VTGFIDARRPQVLVPDGGSNPRHAVFQPSRSGPLDWARRRRSDRDSRRAEVARGRAVTKLARLGDAWKVLDIQEIGLLNPNTFLAIGPGGVFVVIVKQHGRGRVRLAGDVVQIDGKRPQYVAEAKRAAEEASKALSSTAGNTIPVTPILATSMACPSPAWSPRTGNLTTCSPRTESESARAPSASCTRSRCIRSPG
jgi:hypothetical protein